MITLALSLLFSIWCATVMYFLLEVAIPYAIARFDDVRWKIRHPGMPLSRRIR